MRMLWQCMQLGNELKSEQAQDLVEYALLLACIVLASAGAVIGTGSEITALWSIMNNRFTAAGT